MSRASLQLCFVHGTLHPGGAELLRLRTLGILRECGVVTRLCVLGEATDLSERIRAQGIPVDVLPHPVRMFARRTTRTLAAYLRQHRSQVVVGTQCASNYHACVAGRRAGVPLRVAELHGFERWRKWRHRWKERQGVRSASRFLAVSQAVGDARQREIGFARRRLTVLHNPILHVTPAPAPAPVRSREGTFEIGSVGTLRRAKAHDVLIRALARIPHALQARLTLVGDGPERARLQAQVHAADLSKSVRFVGHQDNVASWLERFDAFAFPSRDEGLGIALLEAMGAGVPVVAARTGGIPELLDHGVEGLLVPTEDDAALATALVQIAEDPESAAARAEAARARVLRRHDPERYVDRLLEYYQTWLREAGVRTP